MRPWLSAQYYERCPPTKDVRWQRFLFMSKVIEYYFKCTVLFGLSQAWISKKKVSVSTNSSWIHDLSTHQSYALTTELWGDLLLSHETIEISVKTTAAETNENIALTMPCTTPLPHRQLSFLLVGDNFWQLFDGFLVCNWPIKIQVAVRGRVDNCWKANMVFDNNTSHSCPIWLASWSRSHQKCCKKVVTN